MLTSPNRIKSHFITISDLKGEDGFSPLSPQNHSNNRTESLIAEFGHKRQTGTIKSGDIHH